MSVKEADVATFVLVHGAWGGGWQWRGVARVLRAAGHEVTAPTLAGQGERAHVSCEPITLLTHIDELAEHLWFEDLTEVVLVGWSYGAEPVEGVADRMPERLRMVVNLDGDRVRDGEPSGLEGWPAERVEEFVASGWIPAPTSQDMANVLADSALRQFVAERERKLPTAALTTPFPDSGGRRWQVPHVYLACTEAAAGEPFTDEDLAERAAIKADPRWQYQELPLNHLGILYAPELVASALLDLL
jgi:pimeloyl-ACP methyl ester carboxylesterase